MSAWGLAVNVAKQIETVCGWLTLFVQPGQLTELRALHCGATGRTVCGWFEHEQLDLMARHAVELSKSATGVYFIPNPIDPNASIPGRRRLGHGRVGEARKGDCTEDKHIDKRLWLLIDVDPVRPAGTKATEEQRRAAWDVIGSCLATLQSVGYGPGIPCDSGNGWHLCQPIDLPNDEGSRDKCKRLLQSLQKRCGSEAAKIDVATYNAARIWRIYGTQNAKGKHHG